MSDLYWLSDEQMARIEVYFPKSHGVPRVDDKKVLSGIIFVLKMAGAGGMRPKFMVRTKPFTTGLFVGRNWVCSIGYSALWPRKARRVRL